MFQIEVVEDNKNSHFTINNFFPRISCRFLDYVEKYGTTRQATIYYD